MGREWYFNWGGKTSKKGGTAKGNGGGTGGGCRGNSEKRSVAPQVATAAAAVAASGGCMNTVFHMFDFNLCLHPNNGSYLQDNPISLKGVQGLEAPRNSLESITEDEKDISLNIPMDIQIKTNRRDTKLKIVQAPRAKVEDTLSQSSCSPVSVRTPTLVARLMGLDILPESTNTTPRSSSSYSHISSSTPPSRTIRTRAKTPYKNDGTSPCPETPYQSPSPSVSSQRRRSTDVVDHHRLSLQINKENSIVKEMESSRPSCSAINTKRRDGRKYEDENKSPGYYARQIMKQVRETVSRRSFGADITNTNTANTITHREVRRDEHLLRKTSPTKSKKVRKEASLSTSPKLTKYSEKTNKIFETNSKVDVQEMAVTTMDKVQVKSLVRENETLDMGLKKLGDDKPRAKMSHKSFDSIRNKKDEQFVRPTIIRANSSSIDKKKCKKTPLSSDLVHASVPSFVPLKKDSSSQPPPKLFDKQEGASKAQVSKLINSNSTTTTITTSRLSRNPSQPTPGKVQEEATHKHSTDPQKKESTNTNSTSTSIAEFQYISRILKCTGIDRDTPISFTRWFSPSHPLDPTIFHTLEGAHYHTTTNPDRLSSSSSSSSSSDINPSTLINRKLIFHLVDEILADILKPYIIKFKPFHHNHHQKHNHNQINGFQIVKTLCTKLRSFPSANCQTLQDIDALVEKDLPRLEGAKNSVGFQEEGEAIVVEIEHDIVDSLVEEMALFCLGSSSISSSMQRNVSW